MDSAEIRETFLRFFRERGHLQIPSASLVPHGDPTLLFTSAGMVPFKPYFMGLADPPASRMMTVQKCFRATDIDEVGDFSHLTFFEMLGNFSVGDYFKEEAIAWAWELLTEHFKLPKDKLWCTIYEDDEEAHDLWRKIGVPEERIPRYGEEHNYWFSGNVGPCGPNSEINIDRGSRPDCERCQNGTCRPNDQPECGRFLEIWNLVFMTLYQAEDGTRTPLPRKNIDTGSGLERVTVALQGKENYYDTDVFRPILTRIEELSGKRYGAAAEQDRAMRIVADHTRAAVFLITDGVLPSNEGRGYVLRRLLRRAIYFLTQLGADDVGARGGVPSRTLLDRVAEAVITHMGGPHPDLAERAEFTLRLLSVEEAKFRETLERGRLHLGALLSGAHGTTLAGSQAFELYDTFGFPLELTQEIASRREFTVDVEGFEREMKAQRERGRAAAKFDIDADRTEHYAQLAAQTDSRFVGYDRTSHTTTLAGIVGAAGVQDSASEGETVEVVLVETPLYPEGGGQVGDAGEITGPDGKIAVNDTQSPAEGLIVHRGRVIEGRVAVNDAVEVRADGEKRRASQRNHTATHLLHAALRQVLGDHVRQAGSLVAPDRLRFDFTHIEATKPEELAAVQRLVNEKIREDIEVYWELQPYNDAIAGGAMALFGEKYSARVRVVGICEPGGRNHEGHEGYEGEGGAERPPSADVVPETTSSPSGTRRDRSSDLSARAESPRRDEGDRSPTIGDGADSTRKDRSFDLSTSAAGGRRDARTTGDRRPATTSAERGRHGECFSKELCGGTHCGRTGEIGAFVIVSEASVGSGMRRIEALTGALADEYILEQQAAVARLGRRLNASPADLEARIEAMQSELDAERKRAQQLERQAGRSEVDTLLQAAEQVDGTSIVVARVPAPNAEAMREMGDLLREKLGSAVVVLGAVVEDRPSFLAMVTKDLTGRVHAGNLIKQVAAAAGGGGGGRPDMAQAGGKDTSKLDEALELARKLSRDAISPAG